MSGKPDFSGMDFSGMPDFRGMDLSGMDFSRRDFMKMIKFFMMLGHLSEQSGDFSGMPDLSGMDFSGMDFSGSGEPGLGGKLMRLLMLLSHHDDDDEDDSTMGSDEDRRPGGRYTKAFRMGGKSDGTDRRPDGTDR